MLRKVYFFHLWAAAGSIMGGGFHSQLSASAAASVLLPACGPRSKCSCRRALEAGFFAKSVSGRQHEVPSLWSLLRAPGRGRRSAKRGLFS